MNHSFVDVQYNSYLPKIKWKSVVFQKHKKQIVKNKCQKKTKQWVFFLGKCTAITLNSNVTTHCATSLF